MNRKSINPPNIAGGVNHREQLPRLRRIEGQVRGGLHQMIKNERGRLDVKHQISATINALRRVQVDMLQKHLVALGEKAVAGDS